MRSPAILLLFFAVARPAVAEDIIVAERGSPGLEPSMSSSFVSRYTGNLQYLTSPLFYPLLSGSPSAALMVGDALFVGEGNCTRVADQPGYPVTCAPRVVRYDPTGTSLAFERTLESAPRSIRLSSRGDLVVATQSEIIRFDRISGAALATYRLALPEHSVVSDADVDRAGCTIAVAIGSDGFALLPDRIARGTICGPPSGWTTITLPTAPPNALRGIRFLPDGTLLAAAKTVYRLDRDGHVSRTYDTGQDSSCVLDLARSAGEAVLACGPYLLLLNLETGERSAPVEIRHGIAVGSITTIEQEPPAIPNGRRRSVGH